MKVELTTKQAAILKTLLKNDIEQMRHALKRDFTRPWEEDDRANFEGDIADNEEILRLLEGTAEPRPGPP